MVFGASAHATGGLFGRLSSQPASQPTSQPASAGSSFFFGDTSSSTSTTNLFGGPKQTMTGVNYVCGLYYLDPNFPTYHGYRRRFLPTVSQSAHARIVASTSRTTLTQTFVNPANDHNIPELRYTFPLYDGVSVVGFKCTINNDRVIRGIVKEKNDARKTYDKAVAKGETAGLLEQLPEASDVFTTTIGNVPVGAEIKVEITYLGELKHDAEVDGIRFTIPTSIAPRYGSYPGQLLENPTNVSDKQGMEIVVDAEMPAGSVIKSVQSPSHPIAVTVGLTSTMAANATPSLQFASATLSLGHAVLEKDFIVQIIATNTSNPVAVLETHPTIPHQRAIMATLVPKFKLTATKPEVVFICDRSGSMQDKIDDLKKALQIFMKSLPVGCMFNICSFGSFHSFLFESSKLYDQDTLDTAMKHIQTFGADYGGTHIRVPIEETFKRRHKDLDLEAFVLTDGEVWDQGSLFDMVNEHVEGSNGAIRLFALGVGRDVSHSLIEGLARAGQGFTQTVSEQEKMSGKVVRMLKGALTPHVKDYTLEVRYADAESETEPEDDFEIVEPESPTKDDNSKQDTPEAPKKPISLFDTSADDDAETDTSKPENDDAGADRFSHVPTVKPPKVLQAPFQIPPLYPYSRTSVYLLLSPDRALRNKTPESVILRGTSAQGPLELQIPIAILADKAETVHQLAARKAVKELEEGRGWIFHAKSKGGDYLKKKHPGRFPAMVEREAVRLGVQFQVGGSWCSFVAVEDNDKKAKQEEPTEIVQQAGDAPEKNPQSAHPQSKRAHTGAKAPRMAMKSGAARISAPSHSPSSPGQPLFTLGMASGAKPRGFAFGGASNANLAPSDSSGGMAGSGSVSFAGYGSQGASSLFSAVGGGSGRSSRAAGSVFGTPSSSPFGNPRPVSGGLFGGQTSPTSAAPQQPASGGLFGGQSLPFSDAPRQTAAATSLFGAPSSTTSGGLFGGGGSSQPQAFGVSAFGGGFVGSRQPSPGFSTPGGLFGSAALSTRPASGSLFGSGPSRAQTSDAQRDGDEPLIVQACALAPPENPIDEALMEQHRKEMNEAAQMPLPDLDDVDESLAESAANENASGNSPVVDPPAHRTRRRRTGSNEYFDVNAEVDEEEEAEPLPTDKFSAIVSLQSFSGFWKWSVALLRLLGFTEAVVDKALATSRATNDAKATAVAITFLRMKLEDERESWEMMEEKAIAWLEEEIGEDGARKLLTAAESLYSENLE